MPSDPKFTRSVTLDVPTAMGRALDDIVRTTRAPRLTETGWEPIMLELVSEALARRGALAPDTAPGTSASLCSSQTTPDVEARGAVSLPGEALLRDPEIAEANGVYDGCDWHVYSHPGGGWQYVVLTVDGPVRAFGSAYTVFGAVQKMRRDMDWTAPVGEGVSDV